jgi:hypothetical protein
VLVALSGEEEAAELVLVKVELEAPPLVAVDVVDCDALCELVEDATVLSLAELLDCGGEVAPLTFPVLSLTI